MSRSLSLILYALGSFALSSIVVEAKGGIFGRFGGHSKNQDAVAVAQSIRTGAAVDRSVSQADRAIVQYWLDASKFNMQKCTPNHVDELNNQLKKHRKSSKMVNIDELYNYMIKELLRYCGSRFTGRDLGKRLEDVVGDNREQMRNFGLRFSEWNLGQVVGSPYRIMAEHMLVVVGDDKRGNQNAFMSAWKNGPCKSVLSVVHEPTSRPYADFVKMVQLARFDSNLLEHNALQYWVPVIEGCEYFTASDSDLNDAWMAVQDRDEQIENKVRGIVD